MKRLQLFILMGALSAQALAEPSTALGAGDIVIPAKHHNMFPQAWDAFAGKYDLSNGESMVLRRRGLRMYAEVANRPPTPLVAAAENVFVALDRQLKMRLVDDLGHITGEMVMVAPAQASGQAGSEDVLQMRLASPLRR